MFRPSNGAVVVIAPKGTITSGVGVKFERFPAYVSWGEAQRRRIVPIGGIAIDSDEVLMIHDTTGAAWTFTALSLEDWNGTDDAPGLRLRSINQSKATSLELLVEMLNAEW